LIRALSAGVRIGIFRKHAAFIDKLLRRDAKHRRLFGALFARSSGSGSLKRKGCHDLSISCRARTARWYWRDTPEQFRETGVALFARRSLMPPVVSELADPCAQRGFSQLAIAATSAHIPATARLQECAGHLQVTPFSCR
jgi:hypothetical protein